MTAFVAVARALVAAAFVASTSVSLGWTLCRGIRDRLLPSEALVLALFAGGGTLGVTLFVAGQLAFSLPVVLVVATAALLPLLREQERRSLVDTVGRLRPPSGPTAVLIGCLLLLALIGALLPPAGGMGNDSISYHLAGPAFWIRHHRVLPVPDASHTAFPVAIEALFGAAMTIGGDRAPGVITWIFLLAFLVQIHAVAVWLGLKGRWAELPSVLIAFVPPITQLAGTAFVDVAYAAFGLGVFRLMFDADTRRSLVGPAFLGLATATKYNGLTLAFVTFAIFVFHGARRYGMRDTLGHLWRGAAVSASLAAPFYLRNLLLLGTPIYPPPPLLARHLPGRWFSYEASLKFQAYIRQRGAGLGRGFWDFLALPVRFTYDTSHFHGAGGIGLAPLALSPAAVVSRRDERARIAWLWIIANTIVWFIVQQETRFLFAPIALATILSVAGGQVLFEHFGRVGKATVAAVVGVSVIYGASVMVPTFLRGAVALVSRTRGEARLAADIPFRPAFQYLNAVPGPAKVLILSLTVPPYFLQKDYVKIEGMHEEHPIPGVETARAALERVGELGITHVLDVRMAPDTPDFAVPIPPPPPLRLVFETEDARVFEVAP